MLALMEDGAGQLWISTQDGSVRLYAADSTFLGFLSKEGVVTKGKSFFDKVYSLYQDRSGKIWLGSEHCVYRLSPVGKNFFVRRYPLTLGGVVRNGYPVLDILEVSHLRIWLAT